MTPTNPPADEKLMPAHCPHCGNAKTKQWHLICDPCWSEVSESLRNELLTAHKEGVGDPRHWMACQKVLRFLEENSGLKAMQMMEPITGLIHVCTVRGEDGWEAMCCLWDGERWLFWEDQFDPPEWSPVTDINCVVEAWDLPIMPGSPAYRNRATPPADEKLMPCRWCNSNRVHVEREETSWTGEKVVGVDDDNGPIYYVECDECMSRGPLASWAIDAREKWNATPPAAPVESVTELCANHDNLREYIGQLERERDDAKARAIQAWKDADAAIVKEVESRVASIMGSPDNEIARLTASKNCFRDERDALQAERNTLRSQLAHARSRGDDKEIAEKERDGFMAQLAEARIQVERLEGERDQLRLDLRDMMVRGDAYMEEVDRVRAERDAARAEMARLRGITESAAQMVGVDYGAHQDETVAVIARELAAMTKEREELKRELEITKDERNRARIEAEKKYSEQVKGLVAERDAMKKGDFCQGFEEGKREQQEMRELAEMYRDKAEQERDAARAELAAAMAAYAWLHSQVGGYLRGKDWEHWKQWNEPKALQSVVGGGWIKCGERMPVDYDNWVLAIGPGFPRVRLLNWCNARADSGHWRNEQDDICYVEVTHWRPLPAVPGEGDK